MLNDIKKDAQTRMAKSVEAFRHDLTKLRTGRATTALVDHLKVNYYGSDVPLSQVAGIAVSDARSLTITPYEKQIVSAGRLRRITVPAVFGVSPRSEARIAFSTALTICFSYGVMVSERASETAIPATCDKGTSDP